MNPAQILQWLSRHAVEIKVQDLREWDRSKNRVILSFRTPHDSSVKTVGYSSIGGAVAKADVILRSEKIPVADGF